MSTSRQTSQSTSQSTTYNQSSYSKRPTDARIYNLLFLLLSTIFIFKANNMIATATEASSQEMLACAILSHINFSSACDTSSKVPLNYLLCIEIWARIGFIDSTIFFVLEEMKHNIDQHYLKEV